MVIRQTTLSGNIVAFCRYLREHGFFIGPNEESDSLTALSILEPYRNPEEFQLGLRAILCKTPKQLKAFEALYSRYWKELERALDSVSEEREGSANNKKQTGKQPKAPGLRAIKNWLYGNQQTDTTEAAAYSDLEVGGRAFLANFDERELKSIFELVQQLVRKIANRRSRRFSRTHRRTTIDIKRTIRKNILRNGELIDLIYKAKKKEDLRVVLLCDVSKSMELYSRFLIQFMYAFQHLFPRIKTFVFSTHLYHISDELQHHNLEISLDNIMNKVDHWSGGTRIGSAFEQFNEQYAHKYLHRKTLVLILSDGWDTGESDLMASEMKKINRKAMNVIWLNPLAGSNDWQPEVVGMKAAMPFIDMLLPFHNIEDLKKMIKKIKKRNR
jgi:uncharacterized protein with von Willebrand factor type A (vWA) domain